MNTNWQFDEFRDGRWDGWNSAQIAHFRENRLKSLTREVLQNSLDNPVDPNSDSPVVVKFTQRKIKATLIPGLDSLKENLQAIYNAGKFENPQSRAEILAAIKMASREEIPVLEISDEFTTGMAGPSAVGRPFHNYMKATGSSGGDQGRSGSHGQGKAAPLANSVLRTIFVSTKYPTISGDLELLFQGRCVLMSRPLNPDSAIEKGNASSIGFWGSPNFEPITKPLPTYSWMSREDEGQGTSLFVIGWEERKDWEKLIVAYAIESFFAAFLRNKLELQINGNMIVNKDNLDELFSLSTLRLALKNDGQDEETLDNSKLYLKCLTDGKVIETQITPLPGHSRLNLLLEDDAPKRIAFIRNNILITDQIKTFYKNVPSSLKSFVGTYECLNENGLNMLRSMEPPQHNSLSADWLSADKRDEGTRLLNNLGAKLKAIVKEHAEIAAGEGGEIEILKDFFADQAGDGSQINLDEDINPNGVFRLTPKPFKLRPPKALGLFDDFDLGDDQPSDSGEGGTAGGGRNGDGSVSSTEIKGFGAGNGAGEGGLGEKSTSAQSPASRLPVKSQRFIYDSPKKAVLNFVPAITGIQKIWVFEVGSDVTEPMPISATSMGDLTGGKVIVNVTAGVAERITLSFERQIRGGLKIEVEA